MSSFKIQQKQVEIHKSLNKIKKRIFCIIQSYLQTIINKKQESVQRTGYFTIDESKLEQWMQFFMNQILQYQTRQKIFNPINQVTIQNSQNKLMYVQPPLPNQDQIFRIHNFLVQTEFDKLTMYKAKSWDKFGQKTQQQNLRRQQIKQQNMLREQQDRLCKGSDFFDKSQLMFKKGTLHKRCSLTLLQQQKKLLLMGGLSSPAHPNLKSSKILSFNLSTHQLTQLDISLPYGLSSHSAITNQKGDRVYVVGGNRDFGLISRGCFQIRLEAANQHAYIREIACLNQTSASMTCLMWRNTFIYKIGGIGSSFGQINNSPYIQRYSIALNEWQIINPTLSESLNSNCLQNLTFTAHSLAYSSSNSIIILGGYKINGQSTNYLIQLAVNQQDQNAEAAHVIQRFGIAQGLSGGFIGNQISSLTNNKNQRMFFSLITTQTKAQQADSQFVSYPVCFSTNFQANRLNYC